MVRYSNKSFYGTMDESPGMYAWSFWHSLDYYTTNTTGFWQLMLKTVGDVAKQASEKSGSGKKYATKQADFGDSLTQYQTLYTYAQCTPDLSVSDCYTCLQGAIKNSSISCYMMAGCWMMFPSCTVNYNVKPFYNNVEVPTDSSAADGGGTGFVYKICLSKYSIQPSMAYQTNLAAVLSSLSSNTAQKNGFFNTSAGSGSDTVYGLFLCRGDQTVTDCKACVNAVVNELSLECAQAKVAIMWYEQCMVRFSNKLFIGTVDISPGVYTRNGLYDLYHYTFNGTGFWEQTLNTVGEIAKQAAENQLGKKYATKEANIDHSLTQFQTLYTLAQCTPDLSVANCHMCLESAIKNLSVTCRMMVGCNMLFPSCTVRYDILPFYANSEAPASFVPLSGSIPKQTGSIPKHSKKLPVLVGTVTATALATLLLLGFFFLACIRKFRKQVNDLKDFETVESLKFDFNTIRNATNDFSEDNKLGEGGFGEVYKGMLENGQEVAVKRLSRKSRQGIVQFKTEVLLVAKLQHRNLVPLLGYCLSGKEQLLIYELLPNSSLDRFLFDPARSAYIGWETRYKIICGIAKGLLYLHEDSRLKMKIRETLIKLLGHMDIWLPRI